MPLSNQTVTDAFISKVLSMRAGATICYHVGFLSRDRCDAHGSDAIAKALLEASENGKVILTQRKLDKELYEYLATRTKSRHYVAEGLLE